MEVPLRAFSIIAFQQRLRVQVTRFNQYIEQQETWFRNGIQLHNYKTLDSESENCNTSFNHKNLTTFVKIHNMDNRVFTSSDAMILLTEKPHRIYTQQYNVTMKE